jgi:hypothetical protein
MSDLLKELAEKHCRDKYENYPEDYVAFGRELLERVEERLFSGSFCRSVEHKQGLCQCDEMKATMREIAKGGKA